jgi:two-component system chemotaxis sensor kinase CheA
VADEVVEISGESSREGVSATAVIQDRVTEFLDIDEVISMNSGKAKPRRRAKPKASTKPKASAKSKASTEV